MPRPKTVPKLCRHKASGQAVVSIAGRDHYLGPFGSTEVQAKYDRLIAEWLAAGRPTLVAQDLTREPAAVSVNEVLLRFLDWAEGYYGGSAAGRHELTNIKHAMRPVKALFGSTAASAFGPRSLKAVRAHMLQHQDLCRNEINKRIGRIKRVFKWATSEELVPPSVFQGLLAVEGLRYGRSTARETQPVQPVPDEIIEATLPYLSPQVAAMVQIQRLSGARPSEICNMRKREIDRSSDVWVYRPTCHKTSYRGDSKEILLGPRCQELLVPFLARAEDAFLFSPAEAEDWRNAQRLGHQSPARRTPVYPSEQRSRERRRLQSSRRRRAARRQRDHYDAGAYRRAIEYAVIKAAKDGVTLPRWFPYQIRHTAGTDIRRRHGLEAAQVVLGHTRADVTQIYAERNRKLAIQVAMECG